MTNFSDIYCMQNADDILLTTAHAMQIMLHIRDKFADESDI